MTRTLLQVKESECFQRLKLEHIKLTSFSKMRVDLAAQVYVFIHLAYGNLIIHTKVLSQSVATAIKLGGGEEASETAKFVEMCDKWFDAMNVHNYTQGICSL